MGLESQSAINPRHKSRLIKPDQPSIAWILLHLHIPLDQAWNVLY